MVVTHKSVGESSDFLKLKSPKSCGKKSIDDAKDVQLYLKIWPYVLRSSSIRLE